MQVEDRLPAALPDVDDDAVVLEPCLARAVSATNSSIRLASSLENSPTSRNVSTCARDDEQVYVRLRVDVLDGNEPVGLVRRGRPRGRACRRGSQTTPTIPSSVTPAGAPARASRPGPGRGRATASSRRRSRGRDGRRGPCPLPSFARQRRSQACCEAAREARAALLLDRAGRCRRRRCVCRAAASTGRRAPSSVQRRRRRSVFANACSSSPGKPTMASVVRLKSASGSSRRRYVAAV